MTKILGGAAVSALILFVLVACSNSPTPTAPTWSTSTAPVTGSAQAVQEEQRTIPAAPLQSARKITAREWQQIAKNPDAHVGERVVVYGQVTQFDASTSTSSFRANVGAVEHKPQYGWADYDTNTWLSGEPALLSDVVQGDLFRADATVGGTLSYDAAIGGQRKVPALLVTKIDVIGNV